MEVGCDPRPGWGAVTPRARSRRVLGFTWSHADQILALRSEVPVAPDPQRPGAYGRETLRAGDRRFLSLATASGEPAVFLPLGDAAESRLARSIEWWSEWVAACAYQGPHPEAVVRSLLALKLLTYSPSGAVDRFPDHLAAGGDRRRPQLGSPLLLAGATPPGR